MVFNKGYYVFIGFRFPFHLVIGKTVFKPHESKCNNDRNVIIIEGLIMEEWD